MDNVKPYRIMTGITEEQIRAGDPSFLIKMLTDLENENPEKMKASGFSVTLMFPSVREYPLAFTMWALGLYAKYPNYKYFLDKETVDFINEVTLGDKVDLLKKN